MIVMVILTSISARFCNQHSLYYTYQAQHFEGEINIVIFILFIYFKPIGKAQSHRLWTFLHWAAHLAPLLPKASSAYPDQPCLNCAPWAILSKLVQNSGFQKPQTMQVWMFLNKYPNLCNSALPFCHLSNPFALLATVGRTEGRRAASNAYWTLQLYSTEQTVQMYKVM